MRVRSVAIAAVAVVATSLVIHADPPQTPAQPAFRAGTTLVEVSAIVTADGVPVPDLRAEDVTVLDNGAPQPIAAFERVDLGRGERPSERRDFVLVLDDLHVAAARTKPTIDAALQFVDRLGPHDRLAVVHTGPYDQPLQLTTEREPARRLIRKFRGQGGTAIALELDIRARTAMQVLRDVAASLRSDAVERRAVLLISEGHTAFVQEAPSSLTPAARGAFDDYMGVLREAAMSNVAIYTVDPRGLVAPGGAQIASRDVESAMTQSAQAISNNEIHGSLAVLARNTGGLQTLWTNDLTRVFPQIMQDSRQYYRIAYVQPEPAPGKRQPSSRTIAVKVSRPRVEVRARQQYAPIGQS
jgi:VWFA-related protein